MYYNYPLVNNGNEPFPLFFNTNVSFDLNKDKKVAIVASSGTLLDNEFGDEIDKHDIIIRFNASRVKGYEKHVGSRTDIRIFNGHAFNGDTDEKICLGHDKSFVPSLENEHFLIKSWNYKQFYEGIFNCINKNYINFVHPQFLRCCNDLVSKNEASAGLVGVILATTLGVKPTLYGFGFYSESNDKVHYWEDVNPTWKTGHGFNEEKLIMDRLANQDLIKIRK